MAKVNELNLYFDEDKMINDLIIYLFDTVNKLALWLVKDFESGADNSKIGSSWVNSVYIDAGKKAIIGYVGNNHWYAFIDNYGSGSLMKESNPFLSQYINNNDWYYQVRAEHGNAVLVRPYKEEGYQVPDWESGDGYKTIHGNKGYQYKDGTPINLEQVRGKDGEPIFKPTAGKGWFEDGIRRIDELFEDTIMEAIDKFPFHNYMRGGV